MESGEEWIYLRWNPALRTPVNTKIEIFVCAFRVSLACVASVSSRGSSRKLGQDRSKKKWMTGEGEGNEGFLFSPPPPPSTFFCLRSNVRAITRLETLATQARVNLSYLRTVYFFVTIMSFNSSIKIVPCQIINDRFLGVIKILLPKNNSKVAWHDWFWSVHRSFLTHNRF